MVVKISYRTLAIYNISMRVIKDIDGVTENDKQIAKIAYSLGHPVRVALLRYLLKKNCGKGVDNNTCNGDLVKMFDYSQSTISQHVKVLKDSGLFLTEKHEKFTFYEVNKPLLDKFLKLMEFKSLEEIDSL